MQARGEFLHPPLEITAQQHFGIALGMEAVATGLQLGAQVEKIIDATIEDQPYLPVFAQHGLMPRRAQIENRQAAVAELHPRPFGATLRIRTAPGNRLQHRLKPTRLRHRVCRQVPRNSAHTFIIRWPAGEFAKVVRNDGCEKILLPIDLL